MSSTAVMFGGSVTAPRVSPSSSATTNAATKKRVVVTTTAAAAARALPTQGGTLSATGASALTRAAAAPRTIVSRHHHHQRQRERGAGRGRGPMTVYAIDAAQPFDFEAKQANNLEKKRRQERKLKIGIVGFGNFGQFLAKRFIANGHDLIATSRGDYGAVAKELGVEYFRDPDDFCEMHPDVVIFW